MLFGMPQLMLAVLERELTLLDAERRARLARGERAPMLPLTSRFHLAAWAVIVVAALGVATLVTFVVHGVAHSPAAAAWVYLLVVLPMALRWGRVLGVVTAALAAALVLTILVEPRFSFAVADARDTS